MSGGAVDHEGTICVMGARFGHRLGVPGQSAGAGGLDGDCFGLVED